MRKSIQHFLLPQVHPVSIGGGKSEQCKDYLLLPCRKAELIPVTPVTKHKQLLSATAFLQGSCPFGVSKMSFQEKKKNPQPVSSDNRVSQTLFMFIPSSAPKASADIRTSPICTLQKVTHCNCRNGAK